MRVKTALKSDFKFQLKQGFYTIYLVVIIVYLLVLSFIPNEYKNIILPILVYSDPAGLGMFFIGGIIMLEKEQGIINYLIITPLKVTEYIFSKVVTLSVLGTLVGILITIFSSYEGKVNYLYLGVGLFLIAIFFIYIGIIIVVGCKSLNQYFVKIIPYITLLILPCFTLIGFNYSEIFYLIPSVAGLKIILGAYNNISLIEVASLSLYLLLINYFLLLKVTNIFEEKIVYGG